MDKPLADDFAVQCGTEGHETPLQKAEAENKRLREEMHDAKARMWETGHLNEKLLEALEHMLWLVEVEHKIDGQHITRDAHAALAKARGNDMDRREGPWEVENRFPPNLNRRTS